MRTIDADDAKKRISALRFELTPHYGRLYKKYWSGYHDGIRDAIDAVDDSPTVERGRSNANQRFQSVESVEQTEREDDDEVD